MPVLLKEIDYNAMKHEIVEMDFQALVKGEKVHSVAEVVLLNHDKVKSGVVELFLEEKDHKYMLEYSVIMDKLWPDGSGNTLRMHKAVDRLRALFKESDLSINIQRKNSAYQLIFWENLFEQANNKNVDEMEII